MTAVSRLASRCIVNPPGPSEWVPYPCTEKPFVDRGFPNWTSHLSSPVLVVTRQKEISALRNRFSPSPHNFIRKIHNEWRECIPDWIIMKKWKWANKEYVQTVWRHAIVLPHFDFKRNDTGRDDRGFEPRKTFPIKKKATIATPLIHPLFFLCWGVTR